MARNGLIPDMTLCSTARRAEETWHLVSGHLGDEVEVEIRDDLYHASPRSLIAIIQALSAWVETVLLVGHNPTFEDLALTLSGSGHEEHLVQMALKYPTGALAVIDFSVDSWLDVRAGEGHLRDFVRPRTLNP
jgi:phosphohistidine phosphatase